MIARRLLVSVFSAVLLGYGLPAWAEEAAKPDDSVSFDLSAEDWVVTKTAHVAIDVEAAVSAASAGSMRADMAKAVNDAAKSDWRLTSFTRTQDQTGLERWSVVFDSRLPEAALNGLSDAVKKASKAGMQMTVGAIDFTPTLDETEAARTGLRAHLVKEAEDQLAALNASVPGRNFRLAQITFDSSMAPQAMPMLARNAIAPRAMMASAMQAPMTPSRPESDGQPDTAQKLVVDAHITYAAVPPVATAAAH